MAFESFSAVDWLAAEPERLPNMLSSFSPSDSSWKAAGRSGLKAHERCSSAATVGSSAAGRITPVNS